MAGKWAENFPLTLHELYPKIDCSWNHKQETKMLKILADHGINVRVINGRIEVLEVLMLNGIPVEQWIPCPPTKKALFIWLGY